MGGRGGRRRGPRGVHLTRVLKPLVTEHIKPVVKYASIKWSNQDSTDKVSSTRNTGDFRFISLTIEVPSH